MLDRRSFDYEAGVAQGFNESPRDIDRSFVDKAAIGAVAEVAPKFFGYVGDDGVKHLQNLPDNEVLQSQTVIT